MGFERLTKLHYMSTTQSNPHPTTEQGACPACFAGFVTITVGEDGEDAYEAVPCKRCSEARKGER